MRIIGEFVTELRVERGLSRIELARHLEVSYKTVFLLEEGELEPDKELTEKIVKFFEVTKEELIGGRKQFNNDGSRAVPRDIIRKHKNAVSEYNRHFLILGIVTVIVLILGFVMAMYFRSETGFIISLLIELAVLFIFLRAERKAIHISNNEMLSEKVKFRYYKDIIKFTAYIICVGISSIILSVVFSFFSGIFAKVISIFVIIVVSAAVIYYTDRHLWGAERIFRDKSRHNLKYYNNADVDRELKTLDNYINSSQFFEDRFDD